MAHPVTGERRYDVVVIGGGAAGLSGALALGRARRSVLVIDSGQPRNAPAGGVHGYLGREGTPPAELLRIGRDEVRGYGVTILDGTAVAAARREDGFLVVLADGATVTAARLLVTTGLTDELPDVPGLAPLWGTDVLSCPYCHGWEARDQEIAVLATSPMAVHQALLWRQWSQRITLLRHTGPEVSAADAEQLAARGIPVVEGEVVGLQTAAGRLTGVHLKDGTVVAGRVLVVAPRLVARAGVLASLGLETVDQEVGGHVIGCYVPTDPTGATSVPGVFAAGNVASLVDQVVVAAAAGLRVGAAVNADLVAEETRRAVAARRGEAAPVGPVVGPAGETDAAPGRFWDELYRSWERLWSGKPNEPLVRQVADLPPGTALDLGCGEGADAIWLAMQGWKVTAIDVSQVALDRAAEHAAAEGVGDRIDWQRHDLALSFPTGSYDLVCAQYLHSYLDFPRERVLRRAADAVAPGGVLLVVGHAGAPRWDDGEDRHGHAHGSAEMPTPRQVYAALDLPAEQWEVVAEEVYERRFTRPDGRSGTRPDNALKLRRLSA